MIASSRFFIEVSHGKHWRWLSQGHAEGSGRRYLQNVEQFDAATFGITPAEALVLDPQQRLMLEVEHTSADVSV